MSAGIIAVNEAQVINVGVHISNNYGLCKPRDNLFIFPHDCICHAE